MKPWLIVLFFSFFQSLCAKEPVSVSALRNWIPATVVSEEAVKTYGLDSCFQILTVSDKVFSRMNGKSYKKGCPVPLSDLRYLKILHRNAEGRPQLGEMVCNKLIAKTLIKIFRELYQKNYRIERMVLVDDYDADDEKAMTANNSSCFNYRQVSGSKVLSKHSRGLAVDINSLYNPCLRVRIGKVEPAAGKKYAGNRDTRKDIPFKIDHSDLCYKLFKANGFVWGGDWRTVKDYQHFEYNIK